LACGAIVASKSVGGATVKKNNESRTSKNDSDLIRGIDANLGPRNADSFRADLHPDLKADFVPVWKDLANPPFNMSDWGGENLRQDVRWKFGMPPVNNANYAWIQHFIHHLSPVAWRDLRSRANTVVDEHRKRDYTFKIKRFEHPNDISSPTPKQSACSASPAFFL
jgi:hypothetical protein